MTTKSKDNGKKGRRPTLGTEGSGTRTDNGNNEGYGNCERQEGSFAALRMTANGDERQQIGGAQRGESQ
jgi:hypothetical protein